MSDIGNWFHSLPIFTRTWLLCTVGLTLIGRFQLLSPHTLILSYNEFVHNFEIWRAATSVFYYPLNPSTGFHYMITCYFLYNYSLSLERGEYEGRPADYLFMLLFNWICCVVAGLIWEFPLLFDAMVLSVLYIWCRLNKDEIISFWFGTRFKAQYLPWVLFGFNLLIFGRGLMELIGIFVGHLYCFLKFVYPQEFGGPELLSTPKVLEYYFPPTRLRGFGQAPTRPATAARPQAPAARNFYGGHNWGQGRVLGDN